VADVGCGDGKYFPAIWEAGSFVIGTDISRPLLETAFEKNASSSNDEKVPDTRKVSPKRKYLQARPAVAVADCMSVPLRDNSCDAAICIAVMHHLSTRERRIRCIEELVRIVKPGGQINVQAWAIEQDADSRRRFAANDVFVPFNAQPKYLDKVSQESKAKENGVPTLSSTEELNPSKSVAELYSEVYSNADYDERKGLVVFQRYCHLYREGEMEEIVSEVSGVRLIESGYESGNHFVILQVSDDSETFQSVYD
jgi:SAM-dependent methyltransferase